MEDSLEDTEEIRAIKERVRGATRAAAGMDKSKIMTPGKNYKPGDKPLYE